MKNSYTWINHFSGTLSSWLTLLQQSTWTTVVSITWWVPSITIAWKIYTISNWQSFFLTLKPWVINDKCTVEVKNNAWTLEIDNRTIPRTTSKSYNAWDICEIRDVSEWISSISKNTDDFWEVIRWPWLWITVKWWRIRWSWQENLKTSTNITLTDNATNYIILDFGDWVVKTVSWYWVYECYLLATIVTSSWNITSFTDNRPTYLWYEIDTDYMEYSDNKLKFKDSKVSSIVETTISTSETVRDIIVQEIWDQVQEITEEKMWEQTQTPEEGSIIVWDWDNYILTVTTSSAIYVYTLTDISIKDLDENILQYAELTWTYSSGIITYENWDSVNVTTWVYTVRWWLVAYLNRQNSFQLPNAFYWDTSFFAKTSFPFKVITPSWTTIWYNCSNWMAQKVTITSTSSYTVNLTNASPWTYILYVNKDDSWSATITFWTAWPSPVTWFYKIWSQTYPITIAQWEAHIFVLLIAETAVHISYVWKSVAF